MCGIVGFIGKRYSESQSDLVSMISSIKHRGPDSDGSYQKEFGNVEVNLGHVRLSIIDTSVRASQPMQSGNGRYVLIYNGEIYNFNEIRNELVIEHPDYEWISDSDTEVLLLGIEFWGIEKTVKKAAGMFAFAVWDNEKQTLSLVRDRIGEKPLYYGYQNEQLIFASELGAIEKHSSFKNNINYQAAANFLENGVIKGVDSIYVDIYKVAPGTIIEFTPAIVTAKQKPVEKYYWKLSDIVNAAKQKEYTGNYEDAVTVFDKLLVKVISDQSISDVPIGAFLSGGIDSSVVCAIMKKHVKNDLRTFSIGMPAPGTNEAINAKMIAEHIGSIHTEKYLSISEIKDRIEQIVYYWDEPFADSSQIPTFFVSELARKHVTVSLSGDGADEFLVGYSNYQFYKKYSKYKFLSYLPLLASLNFITKVIPAAKRTNNYKRISSLLKVLSFKDVGELNAYWRNKFRGFNLPVKEKFRQETKSVNGGHNFSYAGYYDVLNYLPDDILVKVDRATMAVSLESRAPFIDHRIIEFIVSLPMSFKFDNGVSKRILKDVLYKYVPKQLVDRPKQGFSIPISEWLKHELHDWADNIINQINPNFEFWDKPEILLLWNEHLTGKYDHGERLWAIIVLELFFKRKLKNS